MPPMDDVNVGITATANTSPGANKAAQDIENAGERMRGSLHQTAQATQGSMMQMLESIRTNVVASSGHFSSLTLRIRETGKAFSEFGEILLAAFAVEKIMRAVEAVGEMGEQMELAAQRTGLTVGELNALKVAGLNTNVAFETVVQGMARFNYNLAQAAQGQGMASAAYRALGISVTDSEGKMKSLSELLPEIADKFHDMEDGVNKSAIATAIGGRAFSAMIPMLNGGREGLAAAEAQARRTGLYMSDSFVHQSSAMEDALKELWQSVKGAGLSLIREFVPALTEVVRGLADLIERFVASANSGGMLWNVLMALATAFDGIVVVCSFVKSGLEQVYEGFSLLLDQMYIVFDTAVRVSSALAHLDFSGAAEAVKQGTKKMEDNAKYHFQQMIKDGQDAVNTLKDMWSHTAGGTDAMPVPKEGQKAEAPMLPKNQPLVETYRQELERLKDAEGSWLEFSKAREVQFWADKLKTVAKGSADYNDIFHEYTTARKAAAKDAYDNEIADLKLQMTEQAKNGEERVRLAKEIADKTAAVYGVESIQAKAALIEVQREQNALYAQQRSAADAQITAEENHANAQVAIEEDTIKTKQQLGELSAIQEVNALKALEEQKYEIALKALNDRLALDHTELAEKLKLQKQIQDLESKHSVEMAKLNNQMVVQTANTYLKFMEPVQRAISGTVQGMIQGTLTLKQGVANLCQSMLASFVDMLAQSLMKWIATEMAKSASAAAGAATRTAIQTTEQTEGMAASATAGKTSIMNDASKAAAGAYAATADIPYIGPILAPAAAAVAFAATAAFGSGIASAAGGWEVPYDTFAMVHKDEKILPARVSKGLDQLLTNQERGATGGRPGGKDVHLHMHINATDAKSFQDQLSRSDSHLYQLSRKFVRNAFGARSINPPVR